MTRVLPHCRHRDPRDAAEILRQLRAAPDVEEVYLAASEDFYEAQDQDHLESTYAAYDAAFEEIAAEMKRVLGTPTFDGSWEDPAYPAFAVGERVVLWLEPEPMYLRLHHEDRELPILIALARPIPET